MNYFLHDLNIAYANIEDQTHNTVRYFIIGDSDVPASGKDKTAILLLIRNESKVLYRILATFQNHDINITNMVPSPTDADIDNICYIDFAGHQEEEAVQAVLRDLDDIVKELCVLGSYPQAVL